MPDSDTPISPFAGLGTAVLVVGMSTILVRRSTVPSFMKVFCRVLLIIALLASVALVRHRDMLTTISERNLLAAGGTGVALAAYLASWSENFSHTTAAVNVTLVQSRPLSITIGAQAVLNERVDRRIAVGIGVTFAGIVLMSVSDFLTVGGTPRPLFGNGLAVVGTVTAVTYVFTGRSVRSRVPLIPYAAAVYSVCAATLLVVAIGRGDPLTGYPPREWLLFLGMTVGPGVFGHTVISWALTHLELGVVSVSLLGEPAGSTILVLLPLGEIPMLPTILDGATALGGIYVGVS